MYIIDNDGYANSDKRFPTQLKDDDNKYIHDEISFWVDKDGNENLGILEERWIKYDDSKTDGTEWLNEKGISVKQRKGGFIKMKDINAKNFHNLLPEFYLRPYEPKFISIKEFNKELLSIKDNLKSILEDDFS